MVTERESMTLNEVGARALGVEERSDETPRARASGAKPAPDPEVVAKPKRRQFTAEYRLRILEEADRCVQPGEVGRLLRREGLYTSHLAAWRKARRQGSLRGLTPSKRGAKPAERNPLVVGGVKPRINGEQHAPGTTKCSVGRQGVTSRQAATRLLRCAPALQVTRRNPLTRLVFMAGSELPAIADPVPRTHLSKMSTPTSCVRHLQALFRRRQHPLSAKVRELEAKVVRLEKELHTAHTILEVQGKGAGLLGFNLSDGKDC